MTYITTLQGDVKPLPALRTTRTGDNIEDWVDALMSEVFSERERGSKDIQDRV